MAKQEDNKTGNEPEENGAGTPAPEDKGGQQTPPEDGLKDKHNEPAINRGHHDRIVAKKDAKIAELEKQLEEANGKAKSGEDALTRVTEQAKRPEAQCP